jgi:hypothetical protein
MVRVPILAVTDPRNARILLFVAFALFAIGLGMLWGTIFWWRRTRVDHPALARLERMPAPRPAARPTPGSAPKSERTAGTDGDSDVDGEATEAAPAPLVVGEAAPAIDPLLRPEEPDPDEAVTSG